MKFKKFVFPNFVLIIFVFFACNTDITKDKEYIYYLNKATLNYQLQKHDSAYFYYNQLKAYCLYKNDDETIIYPLLMMSDIHRLNADFFSSEELATEAISYMGKNTPFEYKAFANNNLGLSYLGQYNYEESNKYYLKSLQDAKGELSKCVVKNNIAFNYIEQKKYKESISILLTIKDNRSIKKDSVEFARVLDNLGYAYFKIGNEKAEYYLKRAYEIRGLKKENIGLISSSLHLAKFYEKKDSKKSKDFAIEALTLAKLLKNPDDQLEVFNFLTKISEGKEAKLYIKGYFKLNDSLQRARQITKNQFAKIRYDSQKAIEEGETQKKIKEYLFYGLLLLIIIAGFIYKRIKDRNKQKIKQASHETEVRIANKLHDELANEVHNAMAFAQTKDLQNFISKEELMDKLEQIYLKARDISNENMEIDTSEMFESKLGGLIASYSNVNRNIICNFNGLEIANVSKEIKITIYRIIQELMVNMSKYSECNLVVINAKTISKRIRIEYRDNGKGVENLESKKRGLINMENRVHSIKGTIVFESSLGNGFKSIIEIPK